MNELYMLFYFFLFSVNELLSERPTTRKMAPFTHWSLEALLFIYVFFLKVVNSYGYVPVAYRQKWGTCILLLGRSFQNKDV